MRNFFVFILLIFISVLAVSQTAYRGSIPEELIRPKRGESPYYPVDLIIGELGRGSASQQAFTFARSIGNGFLSLDMTNSALSSINTVVRENHITTIEVVKPESFRIGGGRQEADGAVSFLIRYIGREQAITGELYIRFSYGSWVFEELLLEEPRDRESEIREVINRIDFIQYERFY